MSPVTCYIFDGREFAKKKEELLKRKVEVLRQKGITPKLVSILVGDDPASALYVSLKKKAAERIGAELQIISLSSSTSGEEIREKINEYSNDKKTHGIMVQLPLPKEIVNSKLSIINSIASNKDIDGLREESPFVPATVKAVLSILDEAASVLNLDLDSKLFTVVGSEGMVGSRLISALAARGQKVEKVDIGTTELTAKLLKADILVSATGVPGLIKGDMVKEGAVVIDVGSPKGDVAFDEVSEKASFITPVPGGVGPVTIVSLLENLIYSASKLW